MEIKWLGHSSFLITDSHGKSILTDPFNASIGYETFKGKVDLVTISHHHFDHNFTKDIMVADNNILSRAGLFNICDIPILGIPSYHDKVQGTKRGDNIIFIFHMDGYRLCHLGDLGFVLSKEEVSKLGNIDILFIPVGGNYTLDGKEAFQLSKLINSHIIIPMHYKTPNLSFPLDGLDMFLSYIKNADKINNNYIKITGDISDMSNKVKILDYK
ncbi:MBL fold metallo-hydrolase [Clostridium rectalis]|uniref:MBL fold metallo-hydrolase n=1 Tax=Clostridium rectalis TaxID=2040295 RepID=UPI000F637D0B|nr:MBL fold metallo-hydrolase [Clostridium rectalis]